MKHRLKCLCHVFAKSIHQHNLLAFLVSASIVMSTWVPGAIIHLRTFNPGESRLEIAWPIGSSCAIAAETPETFDKIGVFSAYTSRCRETKKKDPFTTADGTNLRDVDYCVVANNHLPFNTVIHIEDIGECIVKDRMGRGGAHKFDLYFRDELRKAKKFGVRRLKYKVVRQRSML